MATERVQKILAQAGIASRRKAEELIQEGAVTINGKVAQLGDKAEFGKDAIKVNGRLLTSTEEPVYLAFFKPKAVISALQDPEGRPSLGDYLTKIRTRIYPVGRLDFNSEGLLLLTNDGEFAQQLQTRDDVPRVYRVKVKGHPDKEMIERLARGAKIGDKYFKPHSVRLFDELQSKAQIEVVVLASGAFDIKTYFEMKGFLVDRITRVAIGHMTVHGLSPGQYRMLKKSQVEAILKQPELGMKRLEQEAEKAREKEFAREKAAARREAQATRRGAARDERAPRGDKAERTVIKPRSGAGKGAASKSAGAAGNSARAPKKGSWFGPDLGVGAKAARDTSRQTPGSRRHTARATGKSFDADFGGGGKGPSAGGKRKLSSGGAKISFSSRGKKPSGR